MPLTPLFNLAPDALPVPLAIVDRAGTIIGANPAFCRCLVLGRPPLGSDLVEVFGSEAETLLRPSLRRAFEGQSSEVDLLTLPLGPGVRRFRALLSPLTTGASPDAITLVLLDRPAGEDVDRRLVEAENRFRELADNSPLMLWITEPDGRCTYLNRRWYEFTGQLETEALGLGWLEAVHPEDRAEAGRVFVEANATHAPYQVDYRLRRHDGHYYWAIDAASPRFSREGEFLGYIGSVIDIHARREAEDAARKSRERFDIVRDAAQVGFWFCDLPFTMLEWDKRVKAHFWLPEEAEVPMDLFYERIHPDDRQRTRLAIEESIREHSEYDIEYRTVDPATGAQKWIRAIGRTFYGADGQPLRFDGVTLDVTGAKRAEDELRAAKDEAERASRAKDDFLAQLSHELRTPLTPVLIIADALRDDAAVPAFARAQLDTVARNVALEARLIDDLLDLTRITHGKLTLRREQCDVHELLALVVDMIDDELQEKSLTLSIERTATRSSLTGDPARLQQVLWNLLRNAVKFTPAGGEICIRTFDTEASDGASGGLGIEVNDTGVGFAPEVAETIFAPFERGAAKNDQRFPGLGLGLAIARAVVDLHGGWIEARSEGPGKGATFTLELPETIAAVPVSVGQKPCEAQSKDTDVILKLLFVEDHAPTREVLSRYLRRHGHHVTVAESVATALKAAEADEFDLVLSDLGLPDGTGIELMTRLRERHGLRGIALSGYGMDDDMRRSADAGFVAHLVKPVDVKEVRRALKSFGSPRRAET